MSSSYKTYLEDTIRIFHEGQLNFNIFVFDKIREKYDYICQIKADSFDEEFEIFISLKYERRKQMNLKIIEIEINCFSIETEGDLLLIKGAGDLVISENLILQTHDIFPRSIIKYEEGKKYKITIQELKNE